MLPAGAGERAAEPFEHGKLVSAITRVCSGRSIGADTIDRVARHIEADLLDQRRPSVTSWEIADMVLARLRDLDSVAYDRFAADYMDGNGRVRTEPRADDPSEPQLGLFAEGGDEE